MESLPNQISITPEQLANEKDDFLWRIENLRLNFEKLHDNKLVESDGVFSTVFSTPEEMPLYVYPVEGHTIAAFWPGNDNDRNRVEMVSRDRPLTVRKISAHFSHNGGSNYMFHSGARENALSLTLILPESLETYVITPFQPVNSSPVE